MNEFDPIKAQREVLSGLLDVHKILLVRAREAERKLAEAEADAMSMMKLERFVGGLCEDASKRLHDMEAEAEQ